MAAEKLGTASEFPIVIAGGRRSTTPWVDSVRESASVATFSVFALRCLHHDRCSRVLLALVEVSSFPQSAHTRKSGAGRSWPAIRRDGPCCARLPRFSHRI